MYANEDRRKKLNLEKAKAGVIARPREDSASTRRSHSATSSVVRELISQGMPVRHTGDRPRESNGATHASTQSAGVQGAIDVSDGGIVTNRRTPAVPEVEPMTPLSSSCPCDQGYEEGAAYVDELDVEVTNTPLYPPEILSPENLGDTASSIGRFISGQSVVAQSPTSDILMRVFGGDPNEDRDLIPLVNVGLDLLEANKINDPNEFLQEVEQIVRLIKESRDRSVTPTQSEPGSKRNAGESWVNLAVETASVTGSDQNNEQDRHPKLRKLLDSARLGVFKMGIWATQARRRCTSILKVAKAVVTCSFTVSIVVILNVD